MSIRQLDTIEIPAEETERAAIIGLHGRGSDPRDIAGLARALALPSVRWILPAAPIPMGPGYTWYSRPYTDLSPENRAEFNQSRELLLDLLRQVRANSEGRQAAFLGFSQGGVLATEMAVRSPEPVDAAVSLSGGLYEPDRLHAEISDSAHSTPIFWGHGIYDSILPISAAREQAHVLRTNAMDLTFKEYPLDHSISADELQDARAFLQSVLLAV